MVMKATMECTILFEDEIRLASKAIKEFYALPKDAPGPEHENALRNLVRACYTALLDADDEAKVLLLTRKPTPSKRRK